MGVQLSHANQYTGIQKWRAEFRQSKMASELKSCNDKCDLTSQILVQKGWVNHTYKPKVCKTRCAMKHGNSAQRSGACQAECPQYNYYNQPPDYDASCDRRCYELHTCMYECAFGPKLYTAPTPCMASCYKTSTVETMGSCVTECVVDREDWYKCDVGCYNQKFPRTDPKLKNTALYKRMVKNMCGPGCSWAQIKSHFHEDRARRGIQEVRAGGDADAPDETTVDKAPGEDDPNSPYSGCMRRTSDAELCLLTCPLPSMLYEASSRLTCDFLGNQDRDGLLSIAEQEFPDLKRSDLRSEEIDMHIEMGRRCCTATYEVSKSTATEWGGLKNETSPWSGCMGRMDDEEFCLDSCFIPQMTYEANNEATCEFLGGMEDEAQLKAYIGKTLDIDVSNVTDAEFEEVVLGPGTLCCAAERERKELRASGANWGPPAVLDPGLQTIDSDLLSVSLSSAAPLAASLLATVAGPVTAVAMAQYY